MARILFTTYYEGGFHEWGSLEEWYEKQRNFSSSDESLDILEALYQEGLWNASGVEYRLIEREEFAAQLEQLSARLVWEEGLDQSYLFTATA